MKYSFSGFESLSISLIGKNAGRLRHGKNEQVVFLKRGQKRGRKIELFFRIESLETSRRKHNNNRSQDMIFNLHLKFKESAFFFEGQKPKHVT